jgi:hypothetical protein
LTISPLSNFLENITLKDQQSEHVISDYIIISSTPDVFAQKIHNIYDQVSTTVGYVSDDIVVAILEIRSTDDMITSMAAINTGHYNTIELSLDNEHTILLESDKPLEFMSFNTDTSDTFWNMTRAIYYNTANNTRYFLIHLFKISTQILI